MPPVLCMWNSYSYWILIILAIIINNNLLLMCCEDQKASRHLIKFMPRVGGEVNLPSGTQELGFKKMYKCRQHCPKPKLSQSIPTRVKLKFSAKSLYNQLKQSEVSSSICRGKIQPLKLFKLNHCKNPSPLCFALQVSKELAKDLTFCSSAHSTLVYLYQDT